MLSQPLSSKPSAAKSSATGTVGDRRKCQSPFSEREGASECSHERAGRSAPRPGVVSETYAESWEGTRSQLFLDNKRSERLHSPTRGIGALDALDAGAF